MATPERADALRGPAFVGVMSTAFVVALGFGLIIPILPAFAQSLGAGMGQASLVVAVFALVRLVASPPAGALVDRFGARPVVIAGLVIVAVSTAASSQAGSYVSLVLLRGAGGVGSAFFITGIGQFLVVGVPAGQRGRANGLLQGSFLLGGASGPAVGGLLVGAVGLRTPFLIYAGLLLAAAVVALLLPGRNAMGATVVAGDPETGLDTVAAAAVTRRGGSGVMRLLRDPTFLIALLMSVSLNWAGQGVRFLGVPLFGASLGLSEGTVGLALTASSVAHAILLWPAGRIADSKGRRGPSRIGLAVYTVAMAGLAFATTSTGLFLWLVLHGAATGLASSATAAVVADLAPPALAGRAMGILGVSRDIGSVVGPIATGYLAQNSGFRTAFFVAAALLGLSFLGSLVMRETLQHPDTVA